MPWLQVIGGSYILYLAYQSYRDARIPAGDATLPQGGATEVIVSGFLACVSYPKAIVFFVSLFPGFIDPTLDIAFQSLVYGLIFIVLDVISILGYAFLATATFKSALFRNINHNINSALGLTAIGTVLIARGFSRMRSA